MTDHLPFDDGYEPYHASSPTDRVILELQMYGHRPHQDEPDPRPLPDDEVIRAGLAGIVDTFAGMLGDTRLEPDLDNLLWSFANVFHRAAERIARDLDRNEHAQRSSQSEQYGSEVKSVELERLTAEGITYIERRNAFEIMRDEAADLYEAQTGSAWRPRTGSKVNHQAMTAAVIDFRDFLAARRRAETEVLIPAGTKIAFAGGLDFNDHERVWDALDKAREKHPDMVLLHGGSPRGAERIAACWAENRKVTQIAFKPDWNRHAKAAPFRRNDQLLSVMPYGLIVFPGSGITENLADKARRFGIPVWRFTEDSVSVGFPRRAATRRAKTGKPKRHRRGDWRARGRGERKGARRCWRRRRATMAMIFLGGSRDIFELPVPAIERIGAIVAAEHGVLIGDAPGADAEMQGLLAGYNYEHVGVFHAGAKPRNNLGDWAAYRIPPPDGAKGFAVYAGKDREMARRADFGLMVWDGASPGTCLNVLRLTLIDSPCVVYDTMRGMATTVHNPADWRALIHNAGPDVRRQVEARMTADERLALPA